MTVLNFYFALSVGVSIVYVVAGLRSSGSTH
jgi:hypothetical protein